MKALFPAHAGVIPDGSSLSTCIVSFPRTRGGDPAPSIADT